MLFPFSVFVGLALIMGWEAAHAWGDEKRGFTFAAAISALAAIVCIPGWGCFGRRRKVCIYSRGPGFFPAGRRAPFAAVVGPHPRLPQFRALAFLDYTGASSYVAGIPDEISNDQIRDAWMRGEFATVKISFASDPVPWTRIPPRETLLFRWPDGPEGWWMSPTSREGWWGLIPVVFPLLLLFFFSQPIVLLGLFLFAGAAWVIGRFGGWNDNVVIAAPSGLILSSAGNATVHIPWRDLYAVSLSISPYSNEKEWIAAEYDRNGTKRSFSMRLKSRRFEYERFVQALSTKTDAVPEVAETPEGIRIKVAGFERRAAAGEKVGTREGAKENH